LVLCDADGQISASFPYHEYSLSAFPEKGGQDERMKAYRIYAKHTYQKVFPLYTADTPLYEHYVFFHLA
jgi:hypothetical protein